MKKRYLYTFLILALISCEGKTKFEKPDDLIPKDQMIDMMYDLHIAAAARSVENLYGENNQNYTNLIYQKYNIDSTRFATSNMYYLSDINEYRDMYEDIENRLKKEGDYYRTQMDSITSKENAKAQSLDSIERMEKINSIKKDSL